MHLYILFKKKVLGYLGRKLISSEAMSVAPKRIYAKHCALIHEGKYMGDADDSWGIL